MVMVGAMTRPEFARSQARLGRGQARRRAGRSFSAAATTVCSSGSAKSSSAKGSASSARTRSRRELAAPSGPARRPADSAGRPGGHRLRRPPARGAVGVRRGSGRGRRRAGGFWRSRRPRERTRCWPGSPSFARPAASAQRACRRAGQGAEARAGSAPRHAGGRPADDRRRGESAAATASRSRRDACS